MRNRLLYFTDWFLADTVWEGLEGAVLGVCFEVSKVHARQVLPHALCLQISCKAGVNSQRLTQCHAPAAMFPTMMVMTLPETVNPIKCFFSKEVPWSQQENGD